MIRRLLAPTLLSVVALLAVAEPARAGLLPVQVTIMSESGNFRWTYAIVLPTESQLQSGDYFTIYDFGGLVPGSVAAPEGWAIGVANVGTTPDRLNPDDNAGLPNLTFTYSGSTVNTGQTGLGNFWAVSLSYETTESAFTAKTHRTSDGKPDSNLTETVVPVPTAPPGVPEPTTFALAGVGLALLGFTRRTKRKM